MIFSHSFDGIMRGGRLVLLTLVMLAPLAIADSIQASDALGDERTITSLQQYDGQPQPVECHDASIDLASVRIERGATVRVTYTFAGPLAAPVLSCNGYALAPTDRAWSLHLAGSLPFTATATSAPGAPTATCVRAEGGNHGMSDCAATVQTASDGFWFELPRESALRFEDGWTGSYQLNGVLTARPSAYSRLTVGAAPLTRVVYGAFDSGDARLG